jgi:methylenetetrahydrofolate reductase (NADPH)
MIFPHLERLTNLGWWTVGSQPAIDGASSSDKVVGWGPLSGYVYQKAFVEFFVEKSEVESVKRKIEMEGNGWVHYFAGNYQVSGPPPFPGILFFYSWKAMSSG